LIVALPVSWQCPASVLFQASEPPVQRRLVARQRCLQVGIPALAGAGKVRATVTANPPKNIKVIFARMNGGDIEGCIVLGMGAA
jgi:hypothetical protein